MSMTERHEQAHPVFRSILAAMAPAVEPEMRVCGVCERAYEAGTECCPPACEDCGEPAVDTEETCAARCDGPCGGMVCPACANDGRPYRASDDSVTCQQCWGWDYERGDGISWDEVERMKDSDVRWATNAYPLIELHLTRRECEQVIWAADLPIPEKSACDVCPHRTPSGWAYLKQRDPAAFNYAVETEQRFPGLFLSSQRKPLPVVAAEAESVLDLFDSGDCTSGYCFA